MRAGTGTQSSSPRRKPFVAGAEAGHDRVYSVDGGSSRTVSSFFPEAQDADGGTTFGGQAGTGTDAVQAAPWFEPVGEDGCKDGICSVPWMVSTSTFLTQDRNSNFPGENTIPQRPELTVDVINHPSHYTAGEIECIDAIEAQLTPEEFRGDLKGNSAKYVWRERHKGGTESLKKARFYLNRLIVFDAN